LLTSQHIIHLGFNTAPETYCRAFDITKFAWDWLNLNHWVLRHCRSEVQNLLSYQYHRFQYLSWCSN